MNDVSLLESRQESPTFMTGISAFHPGYLSVSPPVSVEPPSSRFRQCKFTNNLSCGLSSKVTLTGRLDPLSAKTSHI